MTIKDVFFWMILSNAVLGFSVGYLWRQFIKSEEARQKETEIYWRQSKLYVDWAISLSKQLYEYQTGYRADADQLH
jgi:hypothetical protein